MNNSYFHSGISPVSAGIRGFCPRCGKGKIFEGFLRPVPKCSNCDLQIGESNTGDGAIPFIVLVVGLVVVIVALVLEFNYRPSFFVHATVAISLTVALSISLMRPLKGLMIALQYRYDAREGEVQKAEEG